MPFRIEVISGFPELYTPQYRRRTFDIWVDIGPSFLDKEEAKKYLRDYKSEHPNMD